MELNGLVTQDKAESGEWFPVELYGKPTDFDLLILGDDSDTVKRFNREMMRKLRGAVVKEKKGRTDELDDDMLDAMLETTDEAVLVRISAIRGWKRERDKKGRVISETPEPVTLNGNEVKNDRESLRLLISKIPALKEFVSSKARERTNFLSQQSGN